MEHNFLPGASLWAIAGSTFAAAVERVQRRDTLGGDISLGCLQGLPRRQARKPRRNGSWSGASDSKRSSRARFRPPAPQDTRSPKQRAEQPELISLQRATISPLQMVSIGMPSVPPLLARPVPAVRRSPLHVSAAPSLVLCLALPFLVTCLASSTRLRLRLAEAPTLNPQPSVTVSGASQVRLGSTASFTATVSNLTNTAVTWQVNGVAGGNSTVGTITSAGVYTPPATIPANNTVTVTAVSVASPTVSGSAPVEHSQSHSFSHGGRQHRRSPAPATRLKWTARAFVSGAQIQAGGANVTTTFVVCH